MNRLGRIIAIAAILAGSAPAGATEIASKQIAARTELYQIQTLTLSDQQFLTRDAGGKPVSISGELRIARVDPKRIALMGFSPGGQAALYASLKRFQGMWNKSGVEFAAYIPFYPDCRTSFASDTDVADRPIRIFGGTPDDYNPVAACKAYVERLRGAGHYVELTEYPNAPHAFDNPPGAQPAAVAPKYETVRNCQIREAANGVLVDVATGQPFTYRDACVAHGPHLGYDPVAAQAARISVNAFLKSLFALD